MHMSMSFYCYRENADGSITFMDEDLRPNFSNSNAFMILRSLGYEPDYAQSFDPDELMGRVTMARVIPPVSDDGMDNITYGNVTNCGIRPGYFADAYEQIAEVCEHAKAWGVEVVVA